MSLSIAASAAGIPSKRKSSETRPRQEVDTCWHLVAAAALTTCLATVALSNSGFLYVNLMKEFAVNREVASWPGSIIVAMCHIAGIIVAVLQRRISIFRISLFGGMLSSIGFIASRFAPDMTWMNVTLGAIHGLGVGLTLLTLSIILTMHFDRYRGVALGFKYAGWSCSGILFPKLLAFLEEEYGFRDALLIFGAISLNIPALTLFLKEPPGKSLIAQNSETAMIPKTSSWNCDPQSIGLERVGRQKSDSSQSSGRGTKILELLRRPMFFVIIIAAIAADITTFVNSSVLVDYAVDKGSALAKAESLIIYGSISELVGRLIIPLLADKLLLRRCTVVMANFFILGISMVLMPYATRYVEIILGSLCISLSVGFLVSVKPVLMADYLGVEFISACFGCSGLLLVPMLFFTPTIIGIFRDSQGSYDNVFRMLGGINLFVCAICIAVVCFERSRIGVWTLRTKSYDTMSKTVVGTKVPVHMAGSHIK